VNQQTHDRRELRDVSSSSPKVSIALLTTAILLFAATSASAQSLSGSVVAVADGDTVSVQTGAVPPGLAVKAGQTISVRLEGIDAPEHSQSFGDVSRQHLNELIYGKQVNLECQGPDRYARWACKVLLPNGEDVCLDQIEAGMAWHYKQYQRLQNATDRASYGAAEDQARHAKRGLWSEANPVQPQDFRHGTRSQFCADNSDHRIACSDTYEGPVRGNRRSKIYHWPGCPNYDDIADQNRVEFANAIEAEKAGYRGAYNCP
jgi:endonuclease YncB( thermonuclease family)